MLQHAFNEKMKGSVLEEALQECREAAREGYAIAKGNLNETEKAIKGVSVSLSRLLKSLDSGSVRTSGVVDQLKSQFTVVVSELESLQQSSAQNLEEKRKNLDHFSIVLFGRTMAGKSTLMEILTRGDGTSIGTGSQKTTRDVRTYTWNGLEVTDVPGVAAFEGDEDEKLALEAASQADLVIFLISDDAPQPAEAECLARVRDLGKIVLGICNVKIGLDDEDGLKIFLRNPAKPFDQSRIDQILSQFNQLTDQYTPGKRVPFVVTHLRSQYLAQQNEYAKYCEELIKASRFGDIEKKIVQEVTGRGTFLRMKNFIDGAVTPAMRLTELLIEYSEKNLSSGRFLMEKRRQFQDWSKDFKTLGYERIDTQISMLMDELRSEVSNFSELNYDKYSAGDRWNKFIESVCIKNKVEKVQSELLNECKNTLGEIARELKSELSLVADLSNDHQIRMDGIYDLKGHFKIGISALASALGIAALFASGPLGWAAAAAAAVGIGGHGFSLFLEDREEKAGRAREKLSGKLYEHIFKIEKNLKIVTNDWFRQEILSKQVDVLRHDFRAVTEGLYDLVDSQRSLAWVLNDRQKDLGKILIKKVLDQLDSEYLGDYVVDVARVPGYATMLLTTPNSTFPDDVRAKMENLLDEKIWFITLKDGKNLKSAKTKAIENRKSICSQKYEDVISVAVEVGKPEKKVDFIERAQNGLRMYENGKRSVLEVKKSQKVDFLERAQRSLRMYEDDKNV